MTASHPGVRPVEPTPVAPAIVVYAPGRGLMEPIRLMLDYADVPWVDERLVARAQLLELKTSGRAPFGQVPVLEIDGLQLGEARSIVRYLAQTRDLAGDGPADAVRADMLCQRLLDVRDTIAFQPFNADPAAELRRVLTEVVPGRFPAIEAWLARHADLDRGVCIGSRRTVADLVLVDTCEWLLELDPDALAGFPTVVALYAAIRLDPKVERFYSSDRHYPRPDAAYVDQALRAMGLR